MQRTWRVGCRAIGRYAVLTRGWQSLPGFAAQPPSAPMRRRPNSRMSPVTNNSMSSARQGDPAENDAYAEIAPWSRAGRGRVCEAWVIPLRIFLSSIQLKNAAYRSAAVFEGWSMVIHGWFFPGCSDQTFRAPTVMPNMSVSKSLHVRSGCPANAAPCWQWPYVEGLRMDEAMHPVTLMATDCMAGMPKQTVRRFGLVVRGNMGQSTSRSSRCVSSSSSPVELDARRGQ